MNPWENFLSLLGWGALSLLVVVMGFSIYIVIMVFWGLIRKWFSKKDKS